MIIQTMNPGNYSLRHSMTHDYDGFYSEEIAYRTEFNMPDAVGMYLFWRDKTKTVLDRDGVLAVYEQAIRHYDIPILSIEDGFSENDYEGWKKLLAAFGDRLLIIGDDLVTTNDRTIEMAASQGLINTALIKANQIGFLYETLLAMLVALGKGLELEVSHRSKSPNDDMEGHIALAANALGLTCGGGANTERLVKYQAVASLMRRVPDAGEVQALRAGQQARVQRLTGYEEPTNAGIPTVGVEVEVLLPDSGIALLFKGATPLGTSAGAGEAIHLIDSIIENSAVATVLLNPDHTVLIWNKACEELTGIPASRMIGTKDQWSAFYGEQRPTLADIIIDGNDRELPRLYRTYSRSLLTGTGWQAEGWYPDIYPKSEYATDGKCFSAYVTCAKT